MNDKILLLFFICRISLSVDFLSMDLTVGQIVWARLNKNDIYWPGKITIISNNTNDLWSTDIHYNYHVQFFITNQSVWVNDVLPYRQYKDSMTNDSFMNYGLHPGVKQDFLNAIYQADYECNHLPSMTIMNSQQQQQKFISTMENNTDNDFLLTPAPIFTSNTGKFFYFKINLYISA